MEPTYARTFAEYVAWMATNAPHTTILDWWRRLELTLTDYARARGLPCGAGHLRIERAISQDPALGLDRAVMVASLRRRRNEVAHPPSAFVSKDEAIGYADSAFQLIGVLGLLEHHRAKGAA